METVFLDTNVYLDYLLKRSGEKEAEELLTLSTTHKIQVFTSSTCLLQVIYFLKREGYILNEIKVHIESILVFTHLADASTNTFTSALSSGFSDLEDAVQYHTALRVKGIDYFITSNTKDYKKATVQLPVVSPKQFLSLYYKKIDPQA